MSTARQLPIVDIAGIPHYVDVRVGELRPVKVEMPWHFINIDDDFYDHYNEEGDLIGYQFVYDTNDKRIANGEYHSPEDLPKHVQIVTLPLLQELDPVYYKNL